MDVRLSAPDEFLAFPYDRPYSIQADLMHQLYRTIEDGNIAIVESPTGTGKTLSLLTATLTWLRHDKRRSKQITLEGLRSSLHTPGDPEWVATQAFNRIREEYEAEEHAFEVRLADLRAREESVRKKRARVTKRPRLKSPENRVGLEYNEDSLLPDLDERNEGGDTSPFLSDSHSSPSPASRGTKIFFASRTHSQLSQVIRELLRLRPVALDANKTNEQRISSTEASYSCLPRTVSLASRSLLCINEELRVRAIDLDEGCRELLTDNRCPYLPSLGEAHRLHDLRDHILASPKDIEDLVLTGKDMKICPYFGSRSAIQLAEIVILPYNLLLLKNSREALNIDLQDQVIVIDEAHNLIDALLQLHTIELPTSLLRVAIAQLTEYLTRFKTRLNTISAVHLKRLMLFLQALVQFAESDFSQGTNKVMSVSAFVESMGNKVNDINFVELQSYLSESKIARKISKYSERCQPHCRNIAATAERDGNEKQRSGSVFPLHMVEAFISKLTNNITDGVISSARNTSALDDSLIKYQHLNPATYFEEVVHSARCVVLAGGTMSPHVSICLLGSGAATEAMKIPDMTLQLFPDIPCKQVSVLSYGHVIPVSNLQCIVLGSGPRGKELEFKFKNRDDQLLIEELGQCLFNIASLCPNGMVVFYPSYSFLDNVRRKWSASGLLDRLQKKKQIFYEPHDSAEVDRTLTNYSLACKQGALLFAVVGAKLSEGLNFADELARAVILVGIPYPNLASPELRERIKYMSRYKQNATVKGADPGNELYENLAMKAVNQSIGRAIRHQNDWSALVLIDKRYSHPKVQAKLSGWICQSITTPQSFGQAVKSLGEFYRSKRLRYPEETQHDNCAE